MPRRKANMITRAIFFSLSLAACSTEPPLYTGPRSAFDDTAALAARQNCTFKAGDPPGISVPKDAPLGREIPIDTVVVLMMENRSFDHLLGEPARVGQTDVDVAPPTTPTPTPTASAVPLPPHRRYCFDDTNHEWTGTHREYDNGKNDGFVIANENERGRAADGTRAMGYYNEPDLPFLYAAANTFAIADRYFCSVLGPTFPNREYLYAGDLVRLHRQSDPVPAPSRTSSETLQTRARSIWRVYYETLPGPAIFLDTLSKYIDNNFIPQQYFFDDAAAGKLPPVIFVDPNLRDDGAHSDDFHPPGDVQIGDQFLAKVVAALVTPARSGRTSALFITFDEHGGLYDHVPPPPACPPDDIAPILAAGDDAGRLRSLRLPRAAHRRLAVRQAALRLARVYDHTSILRFIEARFELPALTGARRQRRSAVRSVRLLQAQLRHAAAACRRPTSTRRSSTTALRSFPKATAAFPACPPT